MVLRRWPSGERDGEREGQGGDEGTNLHARDHVLVQRLISNSVCTRRNMHINLYPARDISLFDDWNFNHLDCQAQKDDLCVNVIIIIEIIFQV